MISKNKLYFFASLIIFCFAKTTFDFNVNVGVASLSNVKTSIQKKILISPEWRWYDTVPAAGNKGELLRIKTQNEATTAGSFWTKDGSTWLESNKAENNTNAEAYQDYVTSVAKDYALEYDEDSMHIHERHHYEYKNDGIRNQKGGFAAGLSLGVKYELTPCFKIGARAFFTATNIKQDLHYAIIPLDQKGNIAAFSAGLEREVLMLIGWAQAVRDGVDDHNLSEHGIQKLIEGISLKKGTDNSDLILGSSNDKTTNANKTFTAIYGMSINK